MAKKLILFGLAYFLAQVPAWATPEADWSRTASEHRSAVGQRFVYDCPAIAVLPSNAVWGSDVYTDDSSVCLAAVHSGRITAAGGKVTIQILPGQGAYGASDRFGVSTRSYGSWAGSFAFVGSSGAVGPAHGGHDLNKKIPLVQAAGFPHPRVSNDPAYNAIDGNIHTYTWTTEAWNAEAESFLAIAFDRARPVSSLSLWKTNEGGGGEDIKDLTIYYTSDSGPLEQRTWRPVIGMYNGFVGAEKLKAAEVRTDGTVVGDVHNSDAGDGWASLSFATVAATGLRIGFRNQHTYAGCGGGQPVSGCNHYRVAEFEAYEP